MPFRAIRSVRPPVGAPRPVQRPVPVMSKPLSTQKPTSERARALIASAVRTLEAEAGGITTLARAADIVLAVPQAREACPHNLAPTTSTLMQAALGDALAVALLESRGFTALDFGRFHPGGRLGAMIKLVRDIMHTGAEIPL